MYLFHPGFEVASLSDDELNFKSAEIARAIVMAARQNVSYEAIEQMQSMQMSITNERVERSLKESFASRQAMFPEVIETEPDLRVVVDPKKDQKDKPKRPIMRQKTRQMGGLTMRRTPAPTLDGEPPKDN